MGLKRQEVDYSFEQLNIELKSFYEFCKDNGFTNDEIKILCKPFRSSINKATFIKYFKLALICMLVACILHILTYIESVTWHTSAIGRIILIKLLPFWDWTSMKNEKCLITNFGQNDQSIPNINCALCENINDINVENNVDPKYLSKRYINIHVPVILENGLGNWQNSKNKNFSLSDAVISNKILSNSLPCHLSTNIYNGVTQIKHVLQRTNHFDKYFLHFQNCDFEAVKSYRLFVPRPNFLIPEISPVQYSWLLMSKNYTVNKFKMIELREPIAVFGQISGCNIIRLVPRNRCEYECPAVEVELKPGESLIFTSLWDLEYKPCDKIENVAVILEFH